MGRTNERRLVLGMDIGGTKLAAGVVTEDGEQLSAERVPTSSEGPAAVVAQLADLADRAARAAGVPLSGVQAVGLGCVGPLDPKAGRVHSPPNLAGWVDVPLVELLTPKLKRPIHLENDANAAALGEHRFGAGKRAANMVYLTLSTGIGAGVIIGGHLYQGENGNAGELGHTTVAFDGRPCGCGGRGCLEAYASGTAIAARARELLQGGATSALPGMAGGIEKVGAEAVVEAVRQGDPLARRLWDETMEILGAGLANVINAFNPSRIVLGGGVTSAGDLLFEPARRIALRRAMPPIAKAVEIVPAALGAQVGVLGAAAVALDHL